VTVVMWCDHPCSIATQSQVSADCDFVILYSCGEDRVEAAPQAMVALYLQPEQVHRAGPEDCDREGPP